MIISSAFSKPARLLQNVARRSFTAANSPPPVNSNRFVLGVAGLTVVTAGGASLYYYQTHQSSPEIPTHNEGDNTSNAPIVKSAVCADDGDGDGDWKQIHQENTRSEDLRAIQMAAECRRRLSEAVGKIANQTNPNTRGILLAGGVDSCAILEAAASQGITFALAITVVVGEDSPDELYAKAAAKKHGLKHSIIRLTRLQLYETQLAHVIKALAVWGYMDTRNSLVISAAMEEAKKHGLTDVLVGDAADEIFGGYPFMWEPDPTRWKEKRDDMVNQYTFVTQKLAQSYGLVAHQPFRDLADWALSETQRQDCVADDRCKIQSEWGGTYDVQTTGKVLLREAFPNKSAWREMNFIDVGSGGIAIDDDDYWTTQHNITDEVFDVEQAKLKEKGITITSKEQLVNIRMYQTIFGGLVHPTKQRFPVGDSRGCCYCGFEITKDQMFCHLCDAYPCR